MTTSITVKSWRTQMVEFLMNTIDTFRSHHHLSHENAQLRHQLARCTHFSEENAVLHNELSDGRQPPEKNGVLPEQIVMQTEQSKQKPNSSNSMSENHHSSPTNAKTKQIVSENPSETDENVALQAEVAQYREQHAQLLERYEKLNEEMKRKKIDSFESLAEYDKEAMKVFIELARLTEPIPLEGNNIGLFGLTSTGKSTMLNALLGQKVAEIGAGETTTKITPYNGTKFTLWDIPGRNDEVSYLSMEYVSFFKGLSRRLILIQATVKENSSMMKLLDEIGLSYDIVFNKFDKVDQEEQAEVQKQIRSEIEKIGLKGVENVYFVSAKRPDMFSDWITMIGHLVNP